LYNEQYTLAEEMFEKAEIVEKSEIGRSYPMALWGATMATAFNCTKGKSYLRRIPKERDWIMENEKMNIEIGLALYPLTCVNMTEEDKNHFHKTASKIRENYPEDIEAELFYRKWSFKRGEPSKELRRDGINFILDVIAKDKKYETNPAALIFIMKFYAFNVEYYRNGTLLFLHHLKKPSEELYKSFARPGIKASRMFMKVATSSCVGLWYPAAIFTNIGEWKLKVAAHLLCMKVIKLNLIKKNNLLS